MDPKNTWKAIVNSGIYPSQAHSFSDKLSARNRLSVLCILFSLIYVVYFSAEHLYMPLAAISAGILFFALSILLNRYRYYTLSSVLVLLDTNYCVLFFSLYLGFDSGIHLYLLTSPLIVLTLFDTKKTTVLLAAMLSYLLSFYLVVFIGKYHNFTAVHLSQNILSTFYLINFFCSLCLLATLSLYFLYNNTTINSLLIQKNEELVQKQQLLAMENIIRKKAEEEARESLAQREILLSEIHHRVKNNLAVVSGLMELQSAYIDDHKIINVIKESQSRIKSLAILHEKLYENKSLKEVEIGSYMGDLLDFVRISLGSKEKNISIVTRIEPVNLEMTRAMPFALLVNELISNSFKHAFTNHTSGEIEINFSRAGNGYVLNYSDNGIGFDYSRTAQGKSLGLNLVDIFSRQLNGTFEFRKGNPGMTFIINF